MQPGKETQDPTPEEVQGQEPELATDDTEATGGDSATHEVEDELESALQEALTRSSAMEEEILRLRAEMDNFRKRSYREIENARKFALERFMSDLVDVNDNLERGLEAADSDQVSLDQLLEGSQLTLKQLKAVLAKHGLTEIDPKGERFDPERHEAISMAPEGTGEPNTVLEVVQKGYLLNDRLLRPARVVVAA